MSLRRKIALWLCPELGRPSDMMDAGYMGERPPDNQALCNSPKAGQHLSGAAWKFEMRWPSVGAEFFVIPELTALFKANEDRKLKDEAAWEAKVLERLDALVETLNKATEGDNSMNVNRLP